MLAIILERRAGTGIAMNQARRSRPLFKIIALSLAAIGVATVARADPPQR